MWDLHQCSSRAAASALWCAAVVKHSACLAAGRRDIFQGICHVQECIKDTYSHPESRQEQGSEVTAHPGPWSSAAFWAVTEPGPCTLRNSAVRVFLKVLFHGRVEVFFILGEAVSGDQQFFGDYALQKCCVLTVWKPDGLFKILWNSVLSLYAVMYKPPRVTGYRCPFHQGKCRNPVLYHEFSRAQKLWPQGTICRGRSLLWNRQVPPDGSACAAAPLPFC